MPSRKNSLRVLPQIAERVPRRAAQLNQTVSGLIGILVWNYAQAPVPLQAEPDSATLARVNLPCSWRRGLRALVVEHSARCGLSPNAFVESLLAHDLRSPDPALQILPRAGSTKPTL